MISKITIACLIISSVGIIVGGVLLGLGKSQKDSLGCRETSSKNSWKCDKKLSASECRTYKKKCNKSGNFIIPGTILLSVFCVTFFLSIFYEFGPFLMRSFRI